MPSLRRHRVPDSETARAARAQNLSATVQGMRSQGTNSQKRLTEALTRGYIRKKPRQPHGSGAFSIVGLSGTSAEADRSLRRRQAAKSFQHGDGIISPRR